MSLAALSTRIAALQDEAQAARDYPMFDLCCRALSGDDAARRECLDVIEQKYAAEKEKRAMDPNTTLRCIGTILALPDVTPEQGADLDEAVTALQRWIGRGGFEPDWSSQPLAASYYRARLATMAWEKKSRRRDGTDLELRGTDA